MKNNIVNAEGFIVDKHQKINRILASIRKANVVYFTEAELQQVPVGEIFIFDSECYINFWYVAFKHYKSGKVVAFERSARADFDGMKLQFMLWRFCVVGFNSQNYDVPMCLFAATGASCEQLKALSDDLILGELRPYAFEKKYKIKIPALNHIDLIEIAPLQGSLKLYAARLHCKLIQDLPIEPEAILTEAEADVIIIYCDNDLNNTILLFEELADQIKLRIEMSAEYKIDLRSKSDAQISEAVVKSKLAKILGETPKRPLLSEDTKLQFKVPEFIGFQTEEMRSILEDIADAQFSLDAGGSPMWPIGLGEKEKDSWVLKAKIGDAFYKIGMGGLHSQEKSVYCKTDEEHMLLDIDVDSFYPRTILNQRLFPLHLGDVFLTVFEAIVTRRLEAKRFAGKYKKENNKEESGRWKKISDSLKIVINGLFGKLGSKWSAIYAPHLMLQVTITGQLVLLMLIEALHLAGFKIVSANTDGIVLKIKRTDYENVMAIVKSWEKHCDYTTEETRYDSIYLRDVNNYYAFKLKQTEKGWLDEIDECKLKGVFSEKGSALNSILSKNPETLICSDSVMAFLRDGVPVEKTILACKDLNRFVSIKNVKGGGAKDGNYLGKVVRWYYKKGEKGTINYVTSGNKVPKSDGAAPLMELPDSLPTNIDYQWYINEANSILYDIGFYEKPKSGLLF